MKNLILFLLLLMASMLSAQFTTPSVIQNAQKENGISTSALSVKHAYVGAGLGMNISGDVSNSFLFNMQALKSLVSGPGWDIPAMANIGFGEGDSLSTNQGVSLGLYPWYVLHNNGTVEILLHGGVSYTFGDLLDASSDTKFKALLGFQVSVYSAEGAATVFSATPIFVRNLGDVVSQDFGLELSGIVPIDEGLAIFLETILPFSSDVKTGVNVGLLVRGALQNP